MRSWARLQPGVLTPALRWPVSEVGLCWPRKPLPAATRAGRCCESCPPGEEVALGCLFWLQSSRRRRRGPRTRGSQSRADLGAVAGRGEGACGGGQRPNARDARRGWGRGRGWGAHHGGRAHGLGSRALRGREGASQSPGLGRRGAAAGDPELQGRAGPSISGPGGECEGRRGPGGPPQGCSGEEETWGPGRAARPREVPVSRGCPVLQEVVGAIRLGNTRPS